jgi:hypothetical protein
MIAQTASRVSKANLATGATGLAAGASALESIGQAADLASNVADISEQGKRGREYHEMIQGSERESELQREEDERRASQDPVGEDFVPEKFTTLDSDIVLDPMADGEKA